MVLVFSLLILIGAVFVLQKVVQQKKPTDALILQLPKTSINVGETIKTTIVVTPDRTSFVDIAMLDLTYDHTKLELANCTAGENFEPIIAETNPCTLDINRPGIIQIDIEAAEDVEPKGKANIVYLFFKGKTPGTATFSFLNPEVITERDEEPITLDLSTTAKATLTVTSK